MTTACDAVVVGAGHNGLVAANLLADRGWDVVVVEATDRPGGAVQSAEVTSPGFSTDLFSSFYPMTAASPVMTSLALGDHGLRWCHAPTVLAHLRSDGPAAVLHRGAERTADGLEEDRPGDGAAWLRLAAEWDRFGPQMMAALLAPFPPVRAATRLAFAARLDLWDLARRAVLPVRTMAAELFDGPMAPLLLAGNALHADVTPEAAPSALLGWMLVGLGQTVGFPVPVGGAGRITDALLSRLRHAGGEVRTGEPVERVSVEHGRAVGVVTARGPIAARRAVLAACDAQILYGRLLDERHLPAAFLDRMRGFQRASATVKVNYALSAPVAWTDERARDAGTVHVSDSLDELTRTAAELSSSRLPTDPFLLIGQMTTTDPSRSPPGTESLWMYTHVPQDIRGDAVDERDGGIRVEPGGLTGDALGRFVERMEDRIEEKAPGFSSSVLCRHVQGPGDLQEANPSLIGGDISGGTTQLHQQLIFRPVPGLGRAETPIPGLYLASASAHPGGSVHGACGANAARAAVVGGGVRTARKLIMGATAAGTVVVAGRRVRRHRDNPR